MRVNMFLKPTPQLRKQIQDSGKPVIKFDFEEFQKMVSQGKLLANAEVHKILSKNTVSNSSKKTTCPSFLPPAKVRVYESVGKGLGVFATENIPKGEIKEGMSGSLLIGRKKPLCWRGDTRK